ncbi:MAG TPA: hypothetical protein VEB20_24725 [Azospirillaceae bacterium]|nr:hypothetical protein [Azospirillaceae bacterium]
MSSESYVIETVGHAAGVAVADGDGFLFFSADPLFLRLDRHRFGSLAAVHRACQRLEDEAAPARAGRGRAPRAA